MGIEVTNLSRLAGSVQKGFAWSAASEDLNVNLLVLGPGGSVPEHRNDAVDVLLIGVQGEGHACIDGEDLRIGAGDVLIIPKGAARKVASEGETFAYLTCHRRRPGIQVQPLRK